MKAAALKEEVLDLIDKVLERRNHFLKMSALDAIRQHDMGNVDQSKPALHSMMVAKECDAVVREMHDLKAQVRAIIPAEGDNLGGP